jgi:hypothetical protein
MKVALCFDIHHLKPSTQSMNFALGFKNDFFTKKRNDMKKNMGMTDSFIRGSVAIVLTALVMRGTIPETWSMATYIVAAVLLLTSLVNYCPLYTLLGISTCRVTNHG